MKFLTITKPRVFKDWNNAGSLELGFLPENEISIKAVTEFSCGVLSFCAEEAIRFAEGCKLLAQKKSQSTIKVSGEGGCFIQAQYTNDGDPYREGVRITIGVEEQWQDQISLDLDAYGAAGLATAIAEHASVVGAQTSALIVAESDDKELSMQDKAKCWDWFASQYWCLDAVEAYGSLDFEWKKELESSILQQPA